jgi:hypothetical protein
MSDENDLKSLHRQVARAKALVRQTAMKVEDLEASVEEIYTFKERLVIFSQQRNEKRPVRVDRSENAVDFLLT